MDTIRVPAVLLFPWVMAALVGESKPTHAIAALGLGVCIKLT